MTLGDLLDLSRKADDDVEDIEIDLAELGSNLRQKTDDIVAYLDLLDSKAEMHRKNAQKFAAKAKSFENKAEGLREYVAFQLDADNRERGGLNAKPKLTGHVWEIEVKYSERLTPKVHPDANLYFKEFLKPFISRAYTWNKDGLKKSIKSGNDKLSEYASITKHPSIKIKPKS